jgi:hypothetical protein
MKEPEGRALHIAFEAMLGASQEPPLPSVTDAAVAGGRRMRRRRTAVSAAGVLLAAALTVTAAVSLPDSGPDRRPMPASSVSPTPTPSSHSAVSPVPPKVPAPRAITSTPMPVIPETSVP